MKTYYRKETIQAKPMSRRDYEAKILNISTNGDNFPGYYVLGKNGFEAWQPKKAFENGFKET